MQLLHWRSKWAEESSILETELLRTNASYWLYEIRETPLTNCIHIYVVQNIKM